MTPWSHSQEVAEQTINMKPSKLAPEPTLLILHWTVGFITVYTAGRVLAVWGCSDSLPLATRAKAHGPHNSESWNVFSACLVSGNDPFSIVSENTGKCIMPLNDWIVAKDCDETKDMLWKWVSQHRLFHLQSQKCLGLDITKPADSLRMFSCDSSAMLWWKCEHHSLYGAAQYQLALKGGHAIASTNSSDVWKKGGSEESLCAQPYHGESWRGTLTYLLLYLVQGALYM